ncbi:MAG: hypothetical protein BWY59_00612 [Verrucomicrobia bacterium ADurb.Bin345]|nr:MAG: hypothetical protein BWY59_00612 [Verrucomicrobia bacterium ADurb.Bin345]
MLMVEIILNTRPFSAVESAVSIVVKTKDVVVELGALLEGKLRPRIDPTHRRELLLILAAHHLGHPFPQPGCMTMFPAPALTDSGATLLIGLHQPRAATNQATRDVVRPPGAPVFCPRAERRGLAAAEPAQRIEPWGAVHLEATVRLHLACEEIRVIEVVLAVGTQADAHIPVVPARPRPDVPVHRAQVVAHLCEGGIVRIARKVVRRHPVAVFLPALNHRDERNGRETFRLIGLDPALHEPGMAEPRAVELHLERALLGPVRHVPPVGELRLAPAPVLRPFAVDIRRIPPFTGLTVFPAERSHHNVVRGLARYFRTFEVIPAEQEIALAERAVRQLRAPPSVDQQALRITLVIFSRCVETAEFGIVERAER